MRIPAQTRDSDWHGGGQSRSDSKQRLGLNEGGWPEKIERKVDAGNDKDA